MYFLLKYYDIQYKFSGGEGGGGELWLEGANAMKYFSPTKELHFCMC